MVVVTSGSRCQRFPPNQVLREPGSTAEEHEQQAARERIQGAGVPCLQPVSRPQALDYRERRRPDRLVDQDQPTPRGRLGTQVRSLRHDSRATRAILPDRLDAVGFPRPAPAIVAGRPLVLRQGTRGETSVSSSTLASEGNPAACLWPPSPLVRARAGREPLLGRRKLTPRRGPILRRSLADRAASSTSPRLGLDDASEKALPRRCPNRPPEV